MDNQQKLRMTAFRLSFMMEHQNILPDLKEIVSELYPSGVSLGVDKDSPEYLMGAHDALDFLIKFLEQRSPK